MCENPLLSKHVFADGSFGKPYSNEPNNQFQVEILASQSLSLFRGAATSLLVRPLVRWTSASRLATNYISRRNKAQSIKLNASFAGQAGGCGQVAHFTFKESSRH